MLVLGDFNMTENDENMKPIINGHTLYSMIKVPTCFKSPQGTCIDLMLTNRKHCFQHTQAFETGISDHHLMIYTMFKTKFLKLPPKTIKYRSYKKFSEDSFINDLFENLQENPTSDFMSFETKFNSILDKHAPIKQKVFRGNDKPYINKSLRKEISIRSRLRRIANETGNPEDIAKYKKQRNVVTFLNEKTKKNYYKFS